VFDHDLVNGLSSNLKSVVEDLLGLFNLDFLVFDNFLDLFNLLLDFLLSPLDDSDLSNDPNSDSWHGVNDGSSQSNDSGGVSSHSADISNSSDVESSHNGSDSSIDSSSAVDNSVNDMDSSLGWESDDSSQGSGSNSDVLNNLGW